MANASVSVVHGNQYVKIFRQTQFDGELLQWLAAETISHWLQQLPCSV